MDIDEVKRLAETHEVEELVSAEEALMVEDELPFEIKGADDSEILKHITTAIWVREKMESHILTFEKAFDEYKQK